MTDGLIAGFLLGVGTGLILSRVLGWWLAIREWRRASEEARLTDEILRRMLEQDHLRYQRARR